MIEAEQSVIGSLLHDNQSLYRIQALEPEDFENMHLGAVFGKVRTAIGQGQAVDAITLSDIAPNEWRLAVQCAQAVPSARNVGQYASVVRKHGLIRKARQLLCDGLDMLDANEGGTEAIGAVMTNLAAIVTGSDADESFEDVLRAAVETRADEEQGKGRGVSTTIPTLDRITGGFKPGRFYLLGGRPGTFKSVLGWQICLENASRGTPTGLISLEMPSDELGDRAMRAGRDNADLPIRVDTRSRDMTAIEARITEWVRRYAIRIAVVDYAQIITSPIRLRFDALSDISRRFKELAMRLRLPILVLAQVSREVEKEKRPPRPSDLRECGNFEQDADGIVFTSCLERNGRDEFTLINAKQRNAQARTKPIFLHCDGAKAIVREVANEF